jgi:hypothetical protein
MIKKKRIKEDGRYIIFYEFVEGDKVEEKEKKEGQEIAKNRRKMHV